MANLFFGAATLGLCAYGYWFMRRAAGIDDLPPGGSPTRL